MAQPELIEFEHDPRLVDGYLRLLRRVHESDPNWIAPLEGATRAALSPSNPFFRNSANRYRGFALKQGNELVAHVLATVNHLHVASGERVGALGFLEAEPDYRIFEQLITPALHWLEREAFTTRVWATMNFDIWHGYRVMTRGFELPPFFGEPRNGPWLPEFLERAGFRSIKHWVSATTSRAFLVGRVGYFKQRYDQALVDGYRISPMMLKQTAQIADLHRAVSAAFDSFEGYTPITEDAFEALVGSFQRLTGTELATVLEDPAGHMAGFSIAFPDPSGILRRLDGHDGWLHRWRLLFRPASERALHYMIGVLPEARAAHRGLGSALMYDTLCRIISGNYPRTTFALMADDSPARYFAMDQAEAAERAYTLYERT